MAGKLYLDYLFYTRIYIINIAESYHVDIHLEDRVMLFDYQELMLYSNKTRMKKTFL